MCYRWNGNSEGWEWRLEGEDIWLLSTVSALALSGTASAQTWTGFYVGGHGGFGWLRNEQAVTGNNTIATCNFPAAFGDLQGRRYGRGRRRTGRLQLARRAAMA